MQTFASNQAVGVGFPIFMRHCFLALAAVVLLGGCHGVAPSGVETQAPVVAVAKSPNDAREYRYLTLANKLQVLLVSDPNTDKAAASLVVQRGSFNEPEDRPGIAHFLEHMLFIGTEKYPEVDAYQKFIGTHGGSSNAYTAMDHTNYFFDINPPQYRDAMDRFAQFFIAPLFEAEYVEREKNAVFSEYQLQIKDENWRANAAARMALNPVHPGSRFNIGSLTTLDGDIRTDLLKFFRSNYSADQMILVALGNESLDSLQAWVAPMFEQIANHNLGPAPALPPLYAPGQLPATLTIQSVKPSYRVSFEFPVPAEQPHFRSKPLLYITNLLGHEGDGSLHQTLKAKGWIDSLATGSAKFDERTSLVSIDIQLTQAGYQQIPAITKALFDEIALLRGSAPSQRLFTEQAQMLALAFRFQEASSPTGFVYRTAPSLMDTPPAEVLRAPYLMENFDPALIQEYLSYLTTDNVLRSISGPDVTTDKVETWFQVPYAISRAPLPMDDQFNTALQLPAPNEFLPERVDLIDAAAPSAPVKAYAADGVELWVASDTEFGSPRANTFLTLGVPGGFVQPADIVNAQLYTQLVADSLNEYAYPAYLAGLGYQLNVSASGFEVQLSGYDDKQPLLLDKILHAFATLSIDPDRLRIYQQELDKNWRSFRTERPYTQSIAALGNLLVSDSWPPETLANEIAAIDAQSLGRWATKARAKISVQGLLHGNVRADRPQQIAATLQKYLPLSDFALNRSQVFNSSQAQRYALDIDHQDASMILYLQDPNSGYGAQAGAALAAQLLRQAYFTELRTKDQLGYVVGLSYRPYRNRPGLIFIVQSPVADPKQLAERTYRFLDEQIQTVVQLSADEFADFKRGLVSDLTERPKNLNERSGQLWSDLQLGETAFNSRQQIAAAVEGIDQTQAVAILQDLRKRLPKQQILVYSTGKFSMAPNIGSAIESIGAFKES